MKKILPVFFLLSAFFSFPQQLSYIPYQGIMKEIKTPNFIILFPEDKENRAQIAANYCEDIREKLKDFFDWKPYERTTVVLTDNTDYPNGLASPTPRNTIFINLAFTELNSNLKDYEDPLYTLLVHEYTHILHIDQIRGGAWFWRVLYGKLYFPNSGSFNWYIEGMAVLMETLHSNGGRLESAYNEAIIRAAAKNNSIPPYDKIANAVVDWPHGMADYHFGARFVEYLYNTYGEEKFTSFFKDISNDFWPFVLLFVMKFKKIYDKSLEELWNEWIEYEKSKYADVSGDEIKSAKAFNQITDLEGELASFDVKGANILLASYSYKNDAGVYEFSGNSIKKYNNDNIRSISYSNDDQYIYYTKSVYNNDAFTYFDLFSYDKTSNIERRLTRAERINYIALSKSYPVGIMVSHGDSESKIYKFRHQNGKIIEKSQVKFDGDIKYIDAPSLDETGENVVFSAKRRDNSTAIYTLNINTGVSSLIVENIVAFGVKWIDSSSISFITTAERKNILCRLSISENKIYKIFESEGAILNAVIYNGKIFFSDYTYKGEELFSTEYNADGSTDFIVKPVEKKARFDKPFKEYDVKNYNFGRYLLPPIWAFVPAALNSNFYFYANGVLSPPMPYIAPKLILMNSFPLGRFSYQASVALDYIKMYPENSFSFSIVFPTVNINYIWNNWMGGMKYSVNEKYFELDKRGERFPINFSNYFFLTQTLSCGSYGFFYWGISAYHLFKEYDENKYYSNKISFTEQISYYYRDSRIKSSRWDRGFSTSLFFYQSIEGLLDNEPAYVFKADFKARIPFKNVFLFINNESGIEFNCRNVFRTDASLFAVSDSIIDSSPASGIGSIHSKAFNATLNAPNSGFGYFASDIGFDITIYKRSHYIHFATLGFKELFIQVYNEYIYLFNFVRKPYENILFDISFDLTLDLFAAYGKIMFRTILGGAIGYRIGDLIPSWGVSLSFSIGLDY